MSGCCDKIGDTEKWAKKEPDCHFVDYNERSCGDSICFIAFFAFFAGVIYILTLAQAAGSDPYMIINGMDYAGNVCGRGDMTDKPVAIWPYPLDYNLKFCAASCNESLSATDKMWLTYETEEFVGYCMPTDLAALIEQQAENWTDFAFSGDVTAAIGDVYNTQAVIGASIAVALVSALLYTKIVGTCGYALIMGCAMLMIAMGFLLAYWMYNESIVLAANGDTENAEYMEIACYVVAALTFILAIVIFAIRKRIEMAVAIIKAAGQAMRDMPGVMCFPIIPLALGCGYIAFWIFIALNVLSVSNPVKMDFPEALTQPDALGGLAIWRDYRNSDNQNMYVDYVFDDAWQAHFGIVFFHLLWVVQFFVYFNFLVISGAVAHWYFVDIDESTGDKTEMPSGMVMGSCKRACRYNLGSIAFGSFIIAVVDFIRAVVKYIEEKAKSTGEPNAAQKALFCAIQCCLTCVRCCLDKLSKNAYCWIAAWGGNFLQSACSAFKLYLEPENMIRAAAMNFTSSILLFCGKSFVALLTTSICCAIITYTIPVSSLILPAVVIFILALFVGHIFMLEFDVAVDQIFLCFLVDEKVNENCKYGTKSLRGVFNANTEAFKKTDAYKQLDSEESKTESKTAST